MCRVPVELTLAKVRLFGDIVTDCKILGVYPKNRVLVLTKPKEMSNRLMLLAFVSATARILPLD